MRSEAEHLFLCLLEFFFKFLSLHIVRSLVCASLSLWPWGYQRQPPKDESHPREQPKEAEGTKPSVLSWLLQELLYSKSRSPAQPACPVVSIDL